MSVPFFPAVESAVHHPLERTFFPMAEVQNVFRCFNYIQRAFVAAPICVIAGENNRKMPVPSCQPIVAGTRSVIVVLVALGSDLASQLSACDARRSVCVHRACGEFFITSSGKPCLLSTHTQNTEPHVGTHMICIALKSDAGD